MDYKGGGHKKGNEKERGMERVKHMGGKGGNTHAHTHTHKTNRTLLSCRESSFLVGKLRSLSHKFVVSSSCARSSWKVLRRALCSALPLWRKRSKASLQEGMAELSKAAQWEAPSWALKGLRLSSASSVCKAVLSSCESSGLQVLA